MRSIGLLALIAVLGGCDSLFPMTADRICAEQAQLCADLNPDGWCLAQKSQIIKHRYQYEQTPSELLDFYLLEDFEAYKQCISNAAQIVHISQNDKQARRMEAVVVAEQELNRLMRKTRHSAEPHLLLYHWSRSGDKAALNKFLSLEKQNKLNTPSLQLGLASYYVKFNLVKAKQALYKVMELTSKNEQIDPDIFVSLSTISLKQENYRDAYIWAYVAKEFNVSDLDLSQIGAQLKPADQIHHLQALAENYADQIESRQFRAPE